MHKIYISSFHVLDNRPPVRLKLNSLFQLERGKKLTENHFVFRLTGNGRDKNFEMEIVSCLINSFFNAIPAGLLFLYSLCRLRSVWPPSTHRSPSEMRASPSTT